MNFLSCLGGVGGEGGGGGGGELAGTLPSMVIKVDHKTQKNLHILDAVDVLDQ